MNTMNTIHEAKVYCIFNNEIESRLTIGKRYEVMAYDFTTSKYKLINDKMETALYPSGWFTTNESEVVAAMALKNKREENYKEIKCRININDNIVSFTLLDMDKDLLGSGNISEFVGKTSRNQFEITSKNYSFTHASSRHIDIGNSLMREDKKITLNNRAAIKLSQMIMDEIDRINAKLSQMKKFKGPVYMIEHEPGGRKWAYKSTDDIKKGNLVVCNSKTGKYYGLCCAVTTDTQMVQLATAECNLVKEAN